MQHTRGKMGFTWCIFDISMIKKQALPVISTIKIRTGILENLAFHPNESVPISQFTGNWGQTKGERRQLRRELKNKAVFRP